LYEDPLGTGKEMPYNATLGTVEDIWDTAVLAGRMVFSNEYREKIAEDVKRPESIQQAVGPTIWGRGQL